MVSLCYHSDASGYDECTRCMCLFFSVYRNETARNCRFKNKNRKKKAPIRQSLAHFTWCIWVLMLIDVHRFFLTKNHPFSCCTNSDDVTRACRHLYWALRQNLPISAGIQVEEVQIKTKVIGEGFFFRKSHPFKLLQHLSLYNLKIWVSVPILKWRKKLTW